MTKTIWIIGASSGIGKATAMALRAEGHNIVLSARDEEALKAVKSAMLTEKKQDAHDQDRSADESILVAPLDVLDEKSIRTAKSHIVDTFGKLDVMIFMAGIYDPMPLTQYDHKKSLQTLRINLEGAFTVFECIKEEALDPKKSLHLVWTASVAGFRGLPQACAYGVSKAGLQHFAEIQRLELETMNTKVQVINPGFVKTRLTDKNEFEMPMRITPEEAGKAICKGLKSNGFEILFPTGFGLFMKCLRMMPIWLYFKITRNLI